jgi:NADH-quinone oxidoreductase subunit M
MGTIYKDSLELPGVKGGELDFVGESWNEYSSLKFKMDVAQGGLMITWTIWISFIGAAIIMAMPSTSKNGVRWVALGTAFLGLVVGLWFYFQYDLVKGGYQFGNGDGVEWIQALGIKYKVGVDGISLPLVVLTGFIAFTGVLFSWNIEERLKEFFVFFFTLIAGVYGVFQSLDLFLFFVFYEIAIIPKYFIIAIWGSTRKEYGAMKLVLYSFVGSALVFVGALAIYFMAGLNSFDIEVLQNVVFPVEFQKWAFPLVFIGFAILAGMWPFHTWAPTGHVAAPTAASMLLAGVVMKLGAYGCLRVAMVLFPEGMTATILGIPGFWKWTFAILATINIVYGAMVALVQRDFKFVIGYSSVSHMGFVLLGLAALNSEGLNGAVMQMFSHGIVAGLLFAVVGRMVYERTHTRELSELGGLLKAMPFVGVMFIIGALASMGLPGFSGFFAELLVLIGTWKSMPVLLIAIGLGILITVAYTLRTIHKALIGDRKADLTKWEGHLSPVTKPEIVASVTLASLLVLLGIFPQQLMLEKVNVSTAEILKRFDARKIPAPTPATMTQATTDIADSR